MKSRTLTNIAIKLLLIVSLAGNTILSVFIYNSYKQEMFEKVFVASDTNSPYLSDTADLPKIILFGDSRISAWDPLPKIPGHVIIKKGFGGETTSELLLRVQSEVISEAPKTVIIQAGINDLKNIGLLRDYRDTIIHQCSENLIQLTSILTQHDIRVILLSVFPTGKVPLIRKPIWDNEIPIVIKNLNNKLSVIEDENVHFLNTNSILTGDDKLEIEKKFQKDELHLNHEAYKNLNTLLESDYSILTTN